MMASHDVPNVLPFMWPGIPMSITEIEENIPFRCGALVHLTNVAAPPQRDPNSFRDGNK